MEYRNAKFNKAGNIDCEVNHPNFGWIPFTCDSNDIGAKFNTTQLFSEMKQYAAPYTPEPEKPATPDQVNVERTRRLEQGTTVEVTGYGSVAVQGRDQDQITVLALEASARDLTAAGVTDPVIPFRDRDNVQHMLTPAQTTELMHKAKSFAQQIYQASWVLKDANPVPLDYTDDKHWP